MEVCVLLRFSYEKQQGWLFTLTDVMLSSVNHELLVEPAKNH